MWTGRGVSAQVSGVSVLAGNQKLLEEQQISVPKAAQADIQAALQKGCTVIHMVADGKFAGYLVLSDTVRTESAGMIAQLKDLNVQPVLLTGDHENAAAAIASQLQMTEVHTNCLPEDKMRWIADKQQKQESVCMMGDGVNDAPALKKADIGVAMGITGTEVSKDAADMILSDDNFATIIKAVANGRNVYRNIKNAILFLLSGNTAGILAVLYTSLMGLPVPFTPVHLLFINLLTDSLPALAIGMEPADDDLLKEKPRNPREGILTRGFMITMITQGLLIAAASMTAYHIGLTVSSAMASTIAFATLTLARLFHGFNCRGSESIFRLGLTSNRYSLYAFTAGVSLLALVIFIPGLHSVFSVADLPMTALGQIVGLAFMPTVLIQIMKIIRHR